MLNKKTEIVFIGAGRVAHTLIPLLLKKNYNVKGVVSRHKETASSAAGKFKLDFHTSDFRKITVKRGIFFITVPDGQIKNAAEKLASLDLDFKRSLFVHTSGNESSTAMKVLHRKGGLTSSFHIMETFPSHKPVEISDSYAAVETGSRTAQRYLKTLAASLNLKIFIIKEEEKVFYHMAGVFTANFLIANFHASETLIDKTALGRKNQYRLFEPIIKTTLSNLKNNGVRGSLSGPVQRGDYITVQKHLLSLKKLKAKEKKLLLHSYISQSLMLLESIKRNGSRLKAGQVRVKKILEAELKKL